VAWHQLWLCCNPFECPNAACINGNAHGYHMPQLMLLLDPVLKMFKGSIKIKIDVRSQI